MWFMSECAWCVQVYHGDRICLADVLTRPKNSLVYQAYKPSYLPQAQESSLFNPDELAARNHAVNADGFGIAVCMLCHVHV